LAEFSESSELVKNPHPHRHLIHQFPVAPNREISRLSRETFGPIRQCGRRRIKRSAIGRGGRRPYRPYGTFPRSSGESLGQQTVDGLCQVGLARLAAHR
jgi:hypothetical protein